MVAFLAWPADSRFSRLVARRPYAFLKGVYPFLAITNRVGADVLVVEGWVHEYTIRAAVDEFPGLVPLTSGFSQRADRWWELENKSTISILRPA